MSDSASNVRVRVVNKTREQSRICSFTRVPAIGELLALTLGGPCRVVEVIHYDVSGSPEARDVDATVDVVETGG